MNKRMEVTILAVVLVFSLLGCPKGGQEPADPNETATGQITQKADEAFQASADYFAQQKDKLLQTSGEQLNKLEQQFDAWVGEVDTEDDQVKQKLSQLSDSFEIALGQARQAIDKAGALGVEAWQEAKPVLETAVTEARDAYDEFMAYVKAQAREAQEK